MNECEERQSTLNSLKDVGCNSHIGTSPQRRGDIMGYCVSKRLLKQHLLSPSTHRWHCFLTKGMRSRWNSPRQERRGSGEAHSDSGPGVAQTGFRGWIEQCNGSKHNGYIALAYSVRTTDLIISRTRVGIQLVEITSPSKPPPSSTSPLSSLLPLFFPSSSSPRSLSLSLSLGMWVGEFALPC